MGVDYAMKRSFKTHEVSRMDASPRLLDLLRQVLDASRRGVAISAASGAVVARLGGCPLDPHSKAEKPCWGPRERPERLMQWLDCDVAELDRVVVAGETKEAGGPVLAGVGGVGHEVLDGAQVGVEDHGAVELDLDLRTLHGHLLEVPEANRALVADLGGNHAVGRTVVLAWVELAVLRG